MSGTRSNRRYLAPIWAILGVTALGACAELQAAGASSTAETDPALGVKVAQASQTPKKPAAVSPLLAPAPDIFEARGRAVWDGKRTLQGVWVAHPLAASARRVRIYNEQNGQAVDGALFKRDAALEGAAVLISSEAAELLGFVVGENTPLRIVAVKPVEEPSEAPVELSAQAEDQTDQPVESAAAKPEETVGETETKDPKPAAPAQAEKEPEPQVAIVTPVAKPKAPPQDPPKPAVQPEEERVFKFEDPPKEEPEPKPQQQAKAEPKKASSLRRPFLQAGLFGVASNASNLVKRLKSKGIPAKSNQVKVGGKPYNRVVAGPFKTTAARNNARRELRRLGVKDAVPVRR